MKILCEVEACDHDDCTFIQMKVTEQEFDFLQKVSKALQDARGSHTENTLYVYELEAEDG